jgi:transcriptional enhancer factor
LLQRSEKYQTYREKQPSLTPAEVIARDAAERKEQERRKAEGLQQEKDKTVWPDFIEQAFWTGKTTPSLCLALPYDYRIA